MGGGGQQKLRKQEVVEMVCLQVFISYFHVGSARTILNELDDRGC